jgi:endonuclease/exonuclease/phosphatase family metal-dependent hydrolase
MRRNQYLDMQTALPMFDAWGLSKTATCRHPINAIFAHRRRFECLAVGGYWLSKTPHIAGSSAWGSASIRLANWVRLKEGVTDQEFRIINTHLDHVSETARLQQAQMIMADTAAYPPDYPQILCGDMNAEPGSSAINLLTAGGWWDTYAAVHEQKEAGFTYHGFEGRRYQADQKKIDWIFARGGFQPFHATIIREHAGDRYPSDHYFIEADVSP